jgi:hypothetical protein
VNGCHLLDIQTEMDDLLNAVGLMRASMNDVVVLQVKYNRSIRAMINWRCRLDANHTTD